MFEGRNLTFSYDGIFRVKDVSFKIAPGMLVGLFGHNGCGKSTLFSMLAGMKAVFGGDIYLKGQSILGADRMVERSVRTDLGVLLQTTSSDDKLSSHANLSYFAQLMGIDPPERAPKITDALTRAGLCDRAHDPVKKLSGGMRRRLELYRTFMHDPRILLLDEPTEGLDCAESKKFFTFLQGYRARINACALMATHRADELLQCDYVIMMKDGQVIAEGCPRDLIKNLDYVTINFSGFDSTALELCATAPLFDAKTEIATGVTSAKVLRLDLPVMLQHAALTNGSLKSFTVEQPSLSHRYDDLCRTEVSQ